MMEIKNNNAIEKIIKSSHHSFAMIWRRQNNPEEKVDVLYGKEKTLSSVDEIDGLLSPNMKSNGCFVLAPYRQISERGYEVIQDDSPLIAINIEERITIPVEDMISQLSNTKIVVSNARFSDTDEDYKKKVTNVIRNEIGTGQGANFVIKRSFNGEFNNFSIDTMLSIFRKLISKEMGAYWTFIVKTDSHILVGASPEQHIALKDNMVSMMPISGTYRYPPNGPSQEGLINFLKDKKEEEELNMVLDEELKMMTRICDEEVNVDGPFLLPMSKLLHTGYLIHGKSQLSVSRILKDSMFAPTVIGSPIENAARVIMKYEPEGRSYYSGFAALIDIVNQSPEIDSCILIRTIESDILGKFSLSVGATLVRDSNPSSELEETEAKLASLKEAMGFNRSKLFYEDKSISQLLNNKNMRISKFWREIDNYKSSYFSRRDIVIIDNEDSFTSMMAYQLKQMGFHARLLRYTDASDIKDHEIIVVGPGPGDPRDTNDPRVATSLKIIRKAISKNQPFIAICFGHQMLCQVLGLEIELLHTPNQGLQKEIRFFGSKETVGFYNTFTAVYRPNSVNKVINGIDVAFDTSNGHIFGVRGKNFASMQFHPESVLTIDGSRIISESIISAIQL
ncbi:MAG: chorismate-binding protein [Aliivibrio sp.]|uniref:anthranilate synthase family protein n=1 Tax=Aliivibrio sp. TaxID=1872443 RepID=UPI001A609E66|nr:chorismate-binding protein [Aliivibrio sp.]